MKAILTSFRLEETRVKAELIIKRMDEGKSLRDILAEVYVSGFSNKSMMQGYLMADAVIASVDSFETDYENAKINLDAFLDERLTKNTGHLTLHSRCELWLKLKESISKATTIINNKEQDKVDVKAVSAAIDSISVSPEEATEAYEAHLYEELKQTIKDSGILMSGILENISELKISDNTEMLVDTGIKEYDIRAISAMLTYIDLKNNRINGIPEDTTIEQVTQMVCVAAASVEIMQATGETATEKAVRNVVDVLGVLGSMLVLSVIFTVSAIGGLVILLAGGGLVATLAVLIPYIVLCCFIIWAVTCALLCKVLNNQGKVAHTVCVAFRELRRRIARLKLFLTEGEPVSNADKVTVKEKKLITV